METLNYEYEAKGPLSAGLMSASLAPATWKC